MKDAIKTAIDGGWKSKFGYNGFKMNKKSWQALMMMEGEYSKAHLLDPLFWQSLGKQQGWEREFKVSSYGSLEDGSWDSVKEDDFSIPKEVPEWKYRWHKFIDHLADGGDVDTFFNNLLK